MSSVKHGFFNPFKHYVSQIQTQSRKSFTFDPDVAGIIVSTAQILWGHVSDDLHIDHRLAFHNSDVFIFLELETEGKLLLHVRGKH